MPYARSGLTKACIRSSSNHESKDYANGMKNLLYRLQQQLVLKGSKHAYVHGDVKHPPSTNQPSCTGGGDGRALTTCVKVSTPMNSSPLSRLCAIGARRAAFSFRTCAFSLLGPSQFLQNYRGWTRLQQCSSPGPFWPSND
jgi:hypothetical protein